jgi:ABC-2 type transport system permease protein
VHFVTGIGGMATLLLLAILIALGWAAVGVLLALRAGTGEKVQSQFPLLFFLVFISSMNLPRNLIEVNWFRDLATINPVSYLIEGLRTLIIEGWNAQALALGFGVAILMIVGALGGASVALNSRMERT